MASAKLTKHGVKPPVTKAATLRPHRQSRILVGVCIALIIACFAIYGQTLSFGFVNYDDPTYVTNNAEVQAGLGWAGLMWAFTTDRAVHMHPATWVSHMIDCDLYGLQPWGHHLSAVILHTLSAILTLFVFVGITGRFWPSALVAALFAVHPQHVESVAWISERKDVLSMLFWIGSIGAYAWYGQRPGVRRYLLVVLLFLLGLMSKTMVATLPFALLLLDYWPLERIDRTQSLGAMARRAAFLAAEKIPLFVLSAIFSLITYMMQLQGQNLVFGERIPFAARCANAVVVYVLYLVKTVWPSGLAVYYPHPMAARPLWQVAGAAMILAAITLFCLFHARRHPYLIIGWLWYLGTLVPVIELVQFATFSHADRYTYIPHIGIFIMVAWGTADLVGRWRVPKSAVAVTSSAVIAAFGICSTVQAGYWRDSETLFGHAIDVGQESCVAYNNLGAIAMEKGRNDVAEAFFTKALELRPDHISALVNAGKLALVRGQDERANVYFTKALELQPDHVEALIFSGYVNTNLLRYDEGKACLEKALSLQPQNLEALNYMGGFHMRQGHYEEACQYLQKALEIDPQCIPVMLNLSEVLTNLGRRDEAQDHAARAASLRQAGAGKGE